MTRCNTVTLSHGPPHRHCPSFLNVIGRQLMDVLCALRVGCDTSIVVLSRQLFPLNTLISFSMLTCSYSWCCTVLYVLIMNAIAHAVFQEAEFGIMRRECADCRGSQHNDKFFVRKTSHERFDAWQYLLVTWSVKSQKVTTWSAMNVA